MASMTNKQNNKPGPIEIEMDGKIIELCGCGMTSNEDRTCDGTHKTLDEEPEVQDNNKDSQEEETKEEHQCACGGNCGCNH